LSLTTSSQVANKIPVFVTSLEQAVNKKAWWHYQTCCKVWYSHDITRMLQRCNNIVISWLYRTCRNNLATSLIISIRLLQVVNSLFQTCWQLVTSSAKTTCWQLQLLTNLLQDRRFLRVYAKFKTRVWTSTTCKAHAGERMAHAS
jgi:hypothetical protein